MSLINVSAAASAKARAMYAAMLKPDDYRSLSRCANVSEITSYLEANTRYGEVFKSEYSKDLHREQLENLLDSALYIDYTKLCRYIGKDGDYLESYFKRKREVKVIMKAVMHVFVGSSEKIYYNILQTDFDKASRLDILALSYASSYTDVINASDKTEYYSVLKRYTPKDGQKLRIMELDCELYGLVYKLTTEQISAQCSGKEKKDTLEFFSKYIDCLNFVTLRRLKAYCELPYEALSALMISGGGFSDKRLSAMIRAKDTPELYSVIASTPFARAVTGIEEDDALAMKAFSKTCLHALRSSPHPAIAADAYMFLCEVEISNIITALEGIRYSLSEDEIMNMLIII